MYLLGTQHLTIWNPTAKEALSKLASSAQSGKAEIVQLQTGQK
jgi:hypothetical protein